MDQPMVIGEMDMPAMCLWSFGGFIYIFSGSCKLRKPIKPTVRRFRFCCDGGWRWKSGTVGCWI